jgi:hypothetical protein
MSWELLWKIVLIGVVGAFSLMAVLVTILGARDIRKLIKKLRDEEEEE